MNVPEPYFMLAEPQTALRLPPVPHSPGAITPWGSPGHPLRAGSGDVLFGYRVPHLPDFLSDPALVAAAEADRLAQALVRWAGLVANLWKWSHCAFALRLQSRPDRGAIDLALLGRITAPAIQGRAAATAMAADLAQLFSGLRVPLEPIDDPDSLRIWLSPFQQPAVVELRQAEELVELRLGRAYTVFPFWGAAGDWLALCETLVRQKAPAVISVHLEPTALTAEEQALIGTAASVAQQAADFSYSGLHYQNIRVVDPQAATVGRIYAAAAKRLARPFLLSAQVVSPDYVAAATVAQALSVAVTAAPERPITDEERDIPSRSSQLVPRSPAELTAALQTLSSLHLTDWGASDAGAGQERLRYLTNARGAAAAFRLPVAMRGGLPGIVTRQIAPGFNPGPRTTRLEADEILLGTFEHGGLVAIRRAELARHALVAGFTRSGKTNTCLNLLDQLWAGQGLPFLALEPSKTEYRGLLRQPGFEQLLVFTLGDEAVSPFRLNPFELLPGVRVEAHIGALRACFEAALPQFGVLPMLIEEGIHEVYERQGWRLTDQGGSYPQRLFPTMRDLYNVLDRLVGQYTGEVRQNLQAALGKRIGSLLRGSKGRMFNTQRSVPIELLMERPVILEMDRLGEGEQALAMLFVLMFVREHCRARRSGRLEHVTLVEEAHLLMKGAAPVSDPEQAANTQAAGALLFERLLAEIGGLGEGVVVAEQSPSRLVGGAITNTGLKIAHQLVGPREVDAVGDAMIMDDLQKQQLQRLRVGQAAVFMSGYEKATFMTAPAYKERVQFDPHLDDEAVSRHMQMFYRSHPDAVLPFQGCLFCRSRCRHRAEIEAQLAEIRLHQRFYEGWKRLAPLQNETTPEAQAAWKMFAAVAGDAAAAAGQPEHLDAAWCYWVQQADAAFVFRPEHRERFAAASDERAPERQ